METLIERTIFTLERLIEENTNLTENSTQDEVLKQSSSILSEDITNEIETLRNRCLQMETANQAWQQYFEQQFELFRHRFESLISFDPDLTTMEQISEKLFVHLTDIQQQLEQSTTDLTSSSN